MQRDDWMLGDGFPFEDLPDQRKESKQSKQTDEPKVYARELNPVIKAKSEGSPVPSTTSTTKSTTQSLDWTAILVKREVAIIESGEKSIEEVAVERFGSVEEFKKAVQSVESYKRIRFRLKFPNESSNRNVQKESAHRISDNSKPVQATDASRIVR